MGGDISEILSYEPDLMVGTTELDFLHRFLKGECSAYTIYSELANPHVDSQDGKIFSRNVHIFHRLDSRLLGKGMGQQECPQEDKEIG